MRTFNIYYTDYKNLKRFIDANYSILCGKSSSVLAQVFAGRYQSGELLTVAGEIRELIPGAQVIGTTTSGEIMNGVISGLKIVISFSVFQNVKVEARLLEKGNLNDYQLGYSLASRLLNEKSRVLILFSTALKINATQLLNGVSAVKADLAVAGGNAGDNFLHRKTLVSANEECTANGVAGAVLSGDGMTVLQYSHLGWQPIGKQMVITRAEGQRVFTIDNMPAYQIYRYYLGAHQHFELLDGIEFPLVIQKDGFSIARIPYRRFQDDSLAFYGDMEEGDTVRFSFGHINTITASIDDLKQKIKQSGAESLFVYSCAARRSLLGEKADMETLPLQKIAPTSGFFTAGEFFHSGRSNRFLNHTMTILALSEAGHTTSYQEVNDQSDYINPHEESAVSQDRVANRNIGILKALTSLITNVTEELNQRSDDLDNQRHDFINHLQTLYGLITLGEVEQAKFYLEELYNEIQKGCPRTYPTNSEAAGIRGRDGV